MGVLLVVDGLMMPGYTLWRDGWHGQGWVGLLGGGGWVVVGWVEWLGVAVRVVAVAACW